MELSSVSVGSGYSSVSATTSKPVEAPAADTSKAAASEAAGGVVYEGSAKEAPKGAAYGASATDQASIIEKLKADAEARTQQLADLVEKLISQQANADKTSKLPLGDLMKAVANGEIEVDPETVKQAQEDVAEGGYYSVEETAKRLADFAKAISGDDSSKGEAMRAAIDKGFQQATKTWGSELPEISQKTHDRVNELMDEWIKG